MPYISKDAVETVEIEPNVFVRIMVDQSKGSQGIALVRGRMAPGGFLPPHTHDVEEALTVLEGTALSEIGDQTYDLGPGDAVLLPAHIPHKLTNNGEDDLIFVTAFNANAVVRLPVPE
jgi:quercetin dioxygenase-like cupin family protein